jgi:hypothetical protein
MVARLRDWTTGFRSPAETDFFLFTTTSGPSLGSILLPSAEVKNAWSYESISKFSGLAARSQNCKW